MYLSVTMHVHVHSRKQPEPFDCLLSISPSFHLVDISPTPWDSHSTFVNDMSTRLEWDAHSAHGDQIIDSSSVRNSPSELFSLAHNDFRVSVGRQNFC